MDIRSQPYFFSFDTKSKPGKILCHCVRLETIEVDNNENFNNTVFTLLGADYEENKLIRDMLKCAHSFVKKNNLEED